MSLISKNGSLLSPRRVDLFSQLSKEIDSAINEVFGTPFFVNGLKHKGYPLMDAIRNNSNLVIQYTVPGVKLEDLSVEVTEDNNNGKLLTVSGFLHEDYIYNQDSYQIRELSGQEFRRVIRLPEDIGDNEPEASLKDGILKLTFGLKIPKNEINTKSKKLNIKQG